MAKLITELLIENGWLKNPPGKKEDIEKLEGGFNVNLPNDFKQILMFSNGGTLEGYQTAINIFHSDEILALYKEFDLYEDIPQSLIFGGDGGGIFYCYDLRKKDLPILIFSEDEMNYQNVQGHEESIMKMIEKLVKDKNLHK